MNKYIDISNNGEIKINAGAVKESLDNILTISLGEVPFKRDLGNELEKYLYEPFSVINKVQIQSEIIRQVNKHLGDVIDLKEVQVDTSGDKKLYNVKLFYEINGLLDVFETQLKR